MRSMGLLLAVFVLAVVPAGAAEMTGSRAMSGWFNVTTPQGWRGRRFMEGEAIFAEEFDANRDGRMDVWRFFRRGVLTSEERDMNGDGKVDYVSRFSPDTGDLVSVLRDTGQRGVNDIEVDYRGDRRWEIHQDRNLDGITDRISYINSDMGMFNAIGLDPAAPGDIVSGIPPEFWFEVWSDDGFSGAITDYFRYRRAVLTHYGTWNGRRIVWQRAGPGFVPPVRQAAPQLAAAAPYAPPGPAGPGPYPNPPMAGGPYPDPQRAEGPYPAAGPGPGAPYSPPAAPGGRSPGAAEEAIRNPFDMSRGGGDYDPYYGLRPAPPPPPPPPQRPRRADGGPGTPPYIAPPAAARVPDLALPGESLPGNQSFARSVPARMRAPAQTAPSR